MTLIKPFGTSPQATRLEGLPGRFDPWLLGPILALLCIGLVMVTSASMGVAESLGVGPYYFIQRQLIALTLGIVLVIFVCRIELRTLEKYNEAAMLACFLLLILVFVPGLGMRVNGARRWLNFVVLNFQAVEAVKVLLVVWLASYLARRRDEIAAGGLPMLKPFFVVCLLVLLLMAQPDFGSSALLIAITGCMTLMGGANWIWLMGLGAPLIAILAGVAVLAPYRLARITSFWEPFQDPFGSGYQLVQSLIAIGRGGWDGVGLGASIQKLQSFPEVHTDFIFSVFAEETGFLGVCALLALYALLVGRLLWTGLQCLRLRRHFAGLLALGVGSWIGIQATVSIGVNIGMLPTKGLTLPLISYGGSSLMMTATALGLALRVSYELDRARRQMHQAKPDLSSGLEPPVAAALADALAKAKETALMRVEPVWRGGA